MIVFIIRVVVIFRIMIVFIIRVVVIFRSVIMIIVSCMGMVVFLTAIFHTFHDFLLHDIHIVHHRDHLEALGIQR